MRPWFLLVLCACGSSSGGDDGEPSTELTALTVEPASARVMLAKSGAAWSAQQGYTAIATFADGHTRDVTSEVTWGSDDMTAVEVVGNTATVTAAGHYNVSAYLDARSASATLDASLVDHDLGPGFDPVDQAKLDATPSAAAPTIAYPIEGSLFPINVAPLEVHAGKSVSAQSLVRITYRAGDFLDYSYYAKCTASPNPGTFPNACLVSLRGDFARQLAGASETDDIAITVRLAAADGSQLGESTQTTAAWSKTPLSGGLYYWTTAGTGDTTFNTAVARYDFDGDASTPSIYLSSASAPTVPAGQSQCIGCHAVSPDGAKLSFSLGGSTPGFFSLFDVATKTSTMTTFQNRYASMSTFSPDGSRIVTGAYGKLTLRGADAAMTTLADDLFADTVTEKKTHAFWSPSGNRLAFVSWVPTSADETAGTTTGDMVKNGQIWITDADANGPGNAPTLLVPRDPAYTSYYPAISDDDQFVVFNRSSCSGPANSPSGWGTGPCDGYNDISAKLMIVPSGGGAPIALDRANGPSTWTSSWPRWSPDHGTFRGKRLYWVAYSSRRPYGLALAGSTNDTAKPQLWFTAVAVDANGAAPTSDPSFAPVWLPGQDPNLAGPRGNHTPAWTSKVVTLQ